MSVPRVESEIAHDRPSSEVGPRGPTGHKVGSAARIRKAGVHWGTIAIPERASAARLVRRPSRTFSGGCDSRGSVRGGTGRAGELFAQVLDRFGLATDAEEGALALGALLEHLGVREDLAAQALR